MPKQDAMIKKTNTLPVGYRLHQYRIESVLGAGGFGITYKAVHEALQTRAAVKEYFPVEWSYRDRDDVNVLANTQGGLPTSEAGEDACYSWGLERFLNEAQILGKIDHPGVVRVRDFFEANGTAYIVMDYVEGESLGQMLQRERSLTEEQVRRLVEDVLPALEAVHAQGYLHRDLKPANLYRRSDGRTILIDFGAARQALGKRSKSVTSVFFTRLLADRAIPGGRQGLWPVDRHLRPGRGAVSLRHRRGPG
jgi:serine/threonine protein kinase